jgi:hypothetical protein
VTESRTTALLTAELERLRGLREQAKARMNRNTQEALQEQQQMERLDTDIDELSKNLLVLEKRKP